MHFEINADDVRLLNLNVRSEKHGEDDVTALDLKLQWTTSNEALRMFNPALAERLYIPADKRQAPVEGVAAKVGARAFPEMAPFKWKSEVTGLKLTIQHGINAKTDLVLADCTADKWLIELYDGGSVDIVFRVRCVCRDERILGKLGMLIKRDLPMDIEASPDSPKPGDVIDIKGGKARTAEEIFTDQA